MLKVHATCLHAKFRVAPAQLSVTPLPGKAFRFQQESLPRTGIGSDKRQIAVVAVESCDDLGSLPISQRRRWQRKAAKTLMLVFRETWLETKSSFWFILDCFHCNR